MPRRGFDPASLVAGVFVIAFGVVLLLDRTEVIDLRFGYLWPVLFATVGAILLALGLSGARDDDPDSG